MWGLWRRCGVPVAVVLGAMVPSLAHADTAGIRALAPRDLFDAGPAIAGTNVVYAVTDGATIHLASVPASGGAPTPMPDIVTDGTVSDVTLAADAERLAVDAYVEQPSGD